MCLSTRCAGFFGIIGAARIQPLQVMQGPGGVALDDLAMAVPADLPVMAVPIDLHWLPAVVDS